MSKFYQDELDLIFSIVKNYISFPLGLSKCHNFKLDLLSLEKNKEYTIFAFDDFVKIKLTHSLKDPYVSRFYNILTLVMIFPDDYKYEVVINNIKSDKLEVIYVNVNRSKDYKAYKKYKYLFYIKNKYGYFDMKGNQTINDTTLVSINNP